MIIFPAIDILDGKAVRLLQGKYDRATIYGEPVQMAKKWAGQGAEFLHIVDLNGAKDGLSVNLEFIKDIINSVDIPIQLGGGIRTLDNIEMLLNVGVNRVILGTVCVNNPALVKEAVIKFGSEKIVCGIDAKDGKVAVNGWLDSTNESPYDLGRAMKSYGVKYIVYTDIARDGALTGVNVEICKKMADETGLNVVASGGVSSLKDIKKLKKLDLYGVILGKAIYSGKFDVKDALKILEEVKIIE